MKLANKIAIVTGASSGMGRAIAQLFVQEGATVIGFARRKDRIDELASTLTDAAGTLVAFAGDVQEPEAIDNLFDFAVKTYGKVDIVVNNAGVMDDMAPADELSDDLWDKVIGVNLTAVMRITRRALKEMLPRESGVFVNIASLGGLHGARAGAAYTASKFGAVGLTQNVGYFYANKGIRANAICPGAVATDIGVGMQNASPFGLERAMGGFSLNPRTGSAEEIAKVALFLASDDSSFVNATTVVADAGWGAY
ncbi:MAG: SDR family oxidoreductase [Coriobacteriales bacterium]|jgi:NAD(P)-dependent dehydrogenase (short-subunit alcohol dehydrogenase family)|nr:SDR family oxidoreductase [Coriobacteriales bacterium]